MATAKGRRTTAKKPAAQKRPAAKGKGRAKQRAPAVSMPMVGLIVAGISALLFLCLVMPSNAVVIVYLRQLVTATFGQTRYIALALALLLGVQTAFGERWPLRKTSWILLALLWVCVATLLQVFRMSELMYALKAEGYLQNYNGFLWRSYEASRNVPLGGGALGALLGYPLGKYLDVVGSVLLLFFAIGGLALGLIRMFFPGAGEHMGGWWDQFRDDWATRREEKAAERAAAAMAREADEALLVPVPKELFVQEEEDEEPAPARPVKGAKQAPRPKARTQPAPPPRKASPGAGVPRQDATLFDAVPGDTLPYDVPAFDEEPAVPAAQRQPAPQQRKQPVPPPLPTGRQPTLYIEDILPADYPPSTDEPYTQYDAERIKYRSRPSRREPDVLPDFLAKRRAQYDETYGRLDGGRAGEEGPAAGPPGDPAAPDMRFAREPAYEREGYPPDEQGLFHGQARPGDGREAGPPDDAPWDAPRPADAPWEPIGPTYEPEADTARPLRRRRARAQNPLDFQPALDPQTRLDRPDWKPEPVDAPVEAVAQIEEYRQPPFSLLERDEGLSQRDTRAQDAAGAQKLEETLASFGVEARVVKVVHGPAITRYELQPAPGVKVSKIVNLTDDIALNMAAMGVRIEAPIPGKAAIGIEIANDEIETVHLRDVLESDESIRHTSRLAVALGKDIAGKRIIADLARMPHLLIAGATGSGKSVCINTLITSIIYRATPEEVRLILIDPKKVELSVYNGIPHLLVPVVTDAKKASGALSWAVMEMDERYRLFASVGVREIRGYNAQRDDDAPLMPQIVVIIDELSDLMLVAPGEVEESICRLAQLARACGIHLVIATQRPSVNVITGIIKANIPSRIAFAVSSQVDSRTILDSAGAEKLMGKGDMLYAPAGGGKPLRVQGCFVSDAEVARVAEYVKDRHTSDYSQAVIDALDEVAQEESAEEDPSEGIGDALFQQAVEMAVESGQASISMLQRRLRVGYARAGRLIDEMARRNIIGQAEGAKPREVLITREDMAILFRK